ncbi:hypothetical protein ACU4HD_30815 [Cupriavidus basilensis]
MTSLVAVSLSGVGFCTQQLYDIALLGWSLFVWAVLVFAPNSCTTSPCWGGRCFFERCWFLHPKEYDIPLRGTPVTLLCLGKED